MFESFSNEIEEIFNLKIGYTQGELQDGDYEDDNCFKAGNNIVWRYTVLVGYDRSLSVIDWDVNKGKIYRFDDDETLSEQLAAMLEKNSGKDDLFGREIVAAAFESVLQYSFDPDLGSYPCSDEVIENIGGDLYLEEGTDAISSEYVNSLFALKESLLFEELLIKDGDLYIDGEKFDVNSDFSGCADLSVVGFTGDVMDY